MAGQWGLGVSAGIQRERPVAFAAEGNEHRNALERTSVAVPICILTLEMFPSSLSSETCFQPYDSIFFGCF